MRELDATWAFEAAIQDRCAERREPFEWGTALFRLDMPRVHDQNLLRLESGFDVVGARELAADADRLQRAAEGTREQWSRPPRARRSRHVTRSPSSSPTTRTGPRTCTRASATSRSAAASSSRGSSVLSRKFGLSFPSDWVRLTVAATGAGLKSGEVDGAVRRDQAPGSCTRISDSGH